MRDINVRLSRYLSNLILLTISCLVLPMWVKAQQRPRGNPPFQNAKFKQVTAYGQLPMSFEQNVGQADSSVQFVARGEGYSLLLNPTGVQAVLHAPPELLSGGQTQNGKRKARLARTPGQTASMRMNLLGAVNNAARVAGINRMPGSVNYFLGNDRTKWHTGVPTYAKVQYSEVYPGVDLVYYGNQRQLEYDFVVKPGAHSEFIALGFAGANVSSTQSGDLSIDIGGGKITLKKPTVYQVERGKRKAVEGNYVLRGQAVGVNVGAYDRSEPLIIDPVLSYSTFLGGSGNDGIYGVAVDPQGNAYVAGFTDSSNFPIVGTSITPAPNNTTVGFVAKLNSSGTALVYSTYIGGTGGDWIGGLAIDANEYVYIDGYTASTDFPVTAGNAYQATYASGASANGFVTKLSYDGQSLLYSTYLGGTTADWAISIAADANQNAYIAGFATSGNFPVTANALQSTLGTPNGNGFVARIDTTKTGASSLVYSTFLGGSVTTPNEWDQASAIAVDANQNVYVAGMVSSLDFPVTSTAYQPTFNKIPSDPNVFSTFLTQIDTTQSGSAGLIYSTYLGGTGDCGGQASGVTLDPLGDIWVTGGEGCPDYPTTTGVVNSPSGKAFVAKFDTTKSGSASLVCSTLVGGSAGEWSGVIATDPSGSAYIGGWTRSSDFPVTPGAIQSTLGTGGEDSFLAVLLPDASKILYATYFGGTGSQWNDFLYGLAIDQYYDIYVAGTTGSANFQTTPGAFQITLNGPSNGFVAQLTALPFPMISSLSQSEGGAGMRINVFGFDFGSQQNNSTITVNGVAAQVNYWSDREITIVVPQISTAGPVVVTVGGLPSNPVIFDFVLAARANPQSVYISPDEITLLVGESRQLKLVDTQGNEVTDATWSVDNSALATLDYSDIPTGVPTSPSLFGVAQGQATITAVSSLGSAQAIARIYARRIPSGTPAWSVYPDSTNNWFNSIVAGQPKNPGDPDAYIIESLDAGGTSLRAIDANGQQLWRQYYTQSQNTGIGTPDGGVLLTLNGGGGQNLTKLSSDGTTQWTQPNASATAVGYDGTIYGGSGVRDGSSGNLLYQPQGPSGTLQATGPDPQTCSNLSPIPSTSRSGAGWVVAANGKAYAVSQVTNATFTADSVCSANYSITGVLNQTTTTYLFELTPTGQGATVTLATDTYSGHVRTFGPSYQGSWYSFIAYDPNYVGNPNPPPLQIPLTNIYDIAPDGSGGVLIPIVREEQNTNQDNLLIRASGGVQYQIPIPGGNSVVSVSMTDNNVALLSPKGGLQVVTALDPLSGSFLWSASGISGCDTFSVLAATDDGDTLTQDVNYCGSVPISTITQLDGNGVPTGSSATFTEDISNESPEYVFAGSILKQDQNTSAFQDIPVPNIMSNLGTIFPVIGVGHYSKTKAARGIKTSEFPGASPEGCAGYDKKFNAVIVPQTPNSNTLQVQVHRGLNVNLVATGPSGALTFSPSYITGDDQKHQVTVSGGSNTFGTFQIGAFADDGTPLGYAFQVDVKPPLARTLFFYSIGDSTEALTVPSNQLPSQNSLQTQFNRIFPRQANVTFNFQYGGSYSDHYDLDRDHKMHYDPKPLYMSPTSNESGQLFFDFFQNPTYQQLRNNYAQPGNLDPNLVNTFGFYVNAISTDPAGKLPGGMSIPGNAFYPAIVGADWSATTKVSGYTENLTAHELGHILGRGAKLQALDKNNNVVMIQTKPHNTISHDYLMWESNPNGTPCALSRDDWNMMNPVLGSPFSGKVVQQ